MRMLIHLTLFILLTAPLAIAGDIGLKNGTVLKGEIQGLLVLRSKQMEITSGRFTNYMRMYSFKQGGDILSLDGNGLRTRIGSVAYSLTIGWQGITEPEERAVLEFWAKSYKDEDKDSRTVYVNGPSQLPWNFTRAKQEKEVSVKMMELLGELKFQGEKAKLFQEVAIQEEGKADLTIIPIEEIQLWEVERVK